MVFEEEPHYDYAKGTSKDGEVNGHFTQVVWKFSKQIGCAYSVGKFMTYNNAYYVCCDYFPAGNYQGQYATNFENQKVKKKYQKEFIYIFFNSKRNEKSYYNQII